MKVIILWKIGDIPGGSEKWPAAVFFVRGDGAGQIGSFPLGGEERGPRNVEPTGAPGRAPRKTPRSLASLALTCAKAASTR